MKEIIVFDLFLEKDISLINKKRREKETRRNIYHLYVTDHLFDYYAINERLLYAIFLENILFEEFPFSFFLKEINLAGFYQRRLQN